MESLPSNTYGIAAVLGALALLVTACAQLLIPAIVKATPTLVAHIGSAIKAYRERVRQTTITIETVRAISEKMCERLEERLAKVEGERTEIQGRFEAVTAENVDLRTLVATLRTDLAVAVDALVTERHRLSVLRTEYERRIADMTSGGGSDGKALPTPTTPTHVDVVTVTLERKDAT